MEAAVQRFASDALMEEFSRALLDRQWVTRADLEALSTRRALTGEGLDSLLLESGLVPERDILSLLSDLSGVPFRHLAEFKIEPEAVARMSARLALRHGVIPVHVSDGTMLLATARLPALPTVDSLRMLLGLAVDWMLCTGGDISKSLKHFYGLGAETIDALVEGAVEEDEETASQPDISDDSSNEGIIRFVNQIIAEAIRMDATDIHLEPYETGLRLRYRIDGILQEIPLPKGVRALRRALVSCVKIMADLNIAERRKPHDGRIKVRSGADEFDLRVSILPTRFGETANMRILNRKSAFMDLEHLGLGGSQRPKIEYLSSLPHGVVLLTGPTGSGKTTTLYAILSRVNTMDVKIITVEDPIEYQMEGISQIQVHSQIGLTFASILRSILRHDPDVVLIGEIRDSETADIAVRASLTGHLVFSTLHTNDAPSSVMRLIDMGVEPFLVSSCLEGVVAQRLVRRICKSCREEMTPDDVIIEEIGSHCPDRMDGAVYYRGHGCPDCNFTGYRGRIALLEIMLMSEEIRTLVAHQRPSGDIMKVARREGMVTLRRDGWNRVLDGMTTVEEVVRVARRDEVDVSKV